MVQRTVGQGVGFERTRRITGYCAPVKRFCDAKKAELKDRVKHGVGKPAYLCDMWSKIEEAT